MNTTLALIDQLDQMIYARLEGYTEMPPYRISWSGFRESIGFNGIRGHLLATPQFYQTGPQNSHYASVTLRLEDLYRGSPDMMLNMVMRAMANAWETLMDRIHED